MRCASDASAANTSAADTSATDTNASAINMSASDASAIDIVHRVSERSYLKAANYKIRMSQKVVDVIKSYELERHLLGFTSDNAINEEMMRRCENAFERY
jgi:hypothetical protein